VIFTVLTIVYFGQAVVNEDVKAAEGAH
jgi:hypothetical protein